MNAKAILQKSRQEISRYLVGGQQIKNLIMDDSIV